MEIKKINLDDIIYQEIVLRTHKETETHIQWMYDDLILRGLLNLMSLVPSPDEEGKYVVTDGARRMTALKRMKKEGVLPKGFTAIDEMYFVIRDAQTELDTLSDMIAGNANVKKTTNTEFIQAIYKIATETDVTFPELANRVGMTEQYIDRLLKTLKLGDEVLAAAQTKEVPITNLISLSKLAGKVDAEDMNEWVDKASGMVAKDFVLEVAKELDEIKEAMKEKTKEAKFELTPLYIGRDNLDMLRVQSQSAFEQKSTPVTEARHNIMQEIFQMDEPTAKVRERKYEQKQKDKADKAAKRKADRESAGLDESKKMLEEQGFVVTKKE